MVANALETVPLDQLGPSSNENSCRMAARLTSREKQCLHWIANGKTSGETAILLAISESTVNFHLKNTYIKFNASNRSHMVAKAVALGIVKPI